MSIGLYVNTNVSSITAQKYLGEATGKLGKSFERLSSGYRINKASDDAAGISVSENSRKQIRGFNQGIKNTQDALSMANTLDAGLSQLTEMSQRMYELAVQARNGSYSNTERGYMNNEFTELRSQMQQIASTNEFNSINLMDGSAGSISMQVGFSTSQTISTSIFNTSYTTFLNADSIDTQANAATAMTNVDAGIATILGQRAQVGAYMNRLESVLATGTNASENIASSERQIRETNFASETSNLSKYQVIQQAGTSVLAQANASVQSVAQLIQ